MLVKFNKAITAEKFCLLIIVFISAISIYICTYQVFDFFIPSKEPIKFNDTITFGLGVASISLAIILYTDWRDQYIAESLDKDLREIKALVNDIYFIINKFPSTQSEVDVGERAEFFKIFWKLRTLNSYIKYQNFNLLNKELESYLIASHEFINIILTNDSIPTTKISQESKVKFDSINELIEKYRSKNLKIK